METSRLYSPASAPPVSEIIPFIPADEPAICPEEASVHREGVSQSKGVSPGQEDASFAEPRLEEDR